MKILEFLAIYMQYDSQRIKGCPRTSPNMELSTREEIGNRFVNQLGFFLSVFWQKRRLSGLQESECLEEIKGWCLLQLISLVSPAKLCNGTVISKTSLLRWATLWGFSKKSCLKMFPCSEGFLQRQWAHRL